MDETISRCSKVTSVRNELTTPGKRSISVAGSHSGRQSFAAGGQLLQRATYSETWTPYSSICGMYWRTRKRGLEIFVPPVNAATRICFFVEAPTWLAAGKGIFKSLVAAGSQKQEPETYPLSLTQPKQPQKETGD